MTDSGFRPLRPVQNLSDTDDHDYQNTDTAAGSLNGGATPQGPVTAPARVFKGLKRATCSQCRIRKVRCDGREGLCQNCDRLGFECSFSQAPGKTPGGYAVKPPERRRRMQACIPCHAKKVRCHGELPICSCCARKGLACSYPPTRKQHHAGIVDPRQQQTNDSNDDSAPSSSTYQDVSMSEPAPENTTTTTTTIITSSSSLLEPATALGQIEDYFHYLHPLPSFAFLHRTTVIRRCRDGTINEPLKLAICAITSLHLQRSNLRHDLWVQRAEQVILSQLGRPSIFHLQALLLIVRYRIESGEFPTAFMLAALAARTAVALRLNYERSELAFAVAQEARRRLFWGLYLLDDYFCVGLREFELCPEETIHLQLPCHEDIFEAGQQCSTGFLKPGIEDDVSAMGLLGTFIRLVSTRRAIMRFNRGVSLGEESSSMIGLHIQQFEKELAALHGALGPELQYSISNLTSNRWQAQFVMLHMSYHQCYCDLYRMFINGYLEAAPSRVLASIQPRDSLSMQAKCLEHAEEIIRILSDLLNHGRGSRGVDSGDDKLLLERDAAVCAFESARLVMFGARLPCATSTFDMALRKAREVSLRLITEFFPYSASTRPLRTDLEHLIKSYSVRQTQQQFQQQQQQEQIIAEEEPTPRPPARVSQYAASRQRLSVQSLLLQSDFVDDSHEIASSPSSSNGISNKISATAETATSVRGEKARRRATRKRSRYEEEDDSSALSISSASPTFSAATSTPTITRDIPGQEGFIPSSSLMPQAPQSSLPLPLTSITATSITNQLQSQQMPLFSTPSSLLPSTIDARQEDAGLIFNPWMGFTGNEDVYGLGLSVRRIAEEY
ncbi:fungal-specific transcription factor domain-containing protein [Xylariaceae sp. FL0255]|nr:fungal-specific transcription factor domain-containing protein [Xylariaceae sp. FL0255]